LLQLVATGALDSGRLDAEALAFSARDRKTREALRGQLVSARDAPRVGVAKILSYAYQEARDREKVAEWTRYLDERIEQGSAPGAWLAAKSYNQGILFREKLPKTPPRQRAYWLNQAQAAAEGEADRRAVLEEYVDYFTTIGRLDLAVGMIAEKKGTLGDAGGAALERLEMETREALDRWDLEQGMEQASAERSRTAARVKYLRECAARAEQRGDGEELGKLLEAVSALEGEKR
jgi:hypothetical protein